MAHRNTPNISSTVTIALLLSIILSCPIIVFTQNTPLFACNTNDDPTLNNYTFCDTTLDIKTRVDDLISRLTLQEKIGNLVHDASSIDRLGIPGYKWWSEALHGISNVGPATHFSDLVPGATSFPQVILTAASFNKTLFKAIGKVVSTEARAMYNLGLAGLTYWSPNVNIFRDPRWGRGQETPGEDPVLASEYAVNYVRGLQERDDGDEGRLKVAAACKHYTAYDVDDWEGVDRFHFNAKVTKQDMEDTYQPPFKSCVVDGNVASVMCSYNEVNGKPTCGDPDLLKRVIRGEWKLNGYISSDCDSLETMFNSHHSAESPEQVAADALNAGLDLNCGNWLKMNTMGAVEGGLVEESVVNQAVSNNFATLMRLGFFDGDPSKQMYGNLGSEDVCTPAHQELAREAARQGIVLLKNALHSLPLSPSAINSLAVIGPNANATTAMIGNYAGIPCKYTTPLQGLSDYVESVYHAGCSDTMCAHAQLEEAKDAAAKADVVVLVMGTDQSIEAESRDRTSISLPGQQNRLISEVASVSKGPVILVIMSGSGMDIQFAKENPKITSVLWVGFPGEAGGAALADVIFGRYNPGGRLPMTWYPQFFAETVNMTNMNMRPDQTTGHPGYTYRFYRGTTIYPFGYGLSYSTFVQWVVRAPKLVKLSPIEGTTIQVGDSTCRNLGFDVVIGVKNVGRVAGDYSVLMYSYPPPWIANVPQAQLLDFEKVFLAPQEVRLVRFKVNGCRHLSVVDEDGNRKVAFGEHVLQVGDATHSLYLET